MNILIVLGILGILVVICLTCLTFVKIRWSTGEAPSPEDGDRYFLRGDGALLTDDEVDAFILGATGFPVSRIAEVAAEQRRRYREAMSGFTVTREVEVDDLDLERHLELAHAEADRGELVTADDVLYAMELRRNERILADLRASGREAWIQTHTGTFHFLAPTPAQVDPYDLVRTLSGVPRFINRTIAHWPVAQHLVLTALLLWKRTHVPAVALHGLAHDLHEAYMGDLPTPFLWAIGPDAAGRVKALKRLYDEAIFARIGLEPTLVPDSTALVKTADADMLIWERDRLCRRPESPWFLDGKTTILTPESFGLDQDSILLQPMSAAQSAFALAWLLSRWASDTVSSEFHVQFRCDARPLIADALRAAVSNLQA